MGRSICSTGFSTWFAAGYQPRLSPSGIPIAAAVPNPMATRRNESPDIAPQDMIAQQLGQAFFDAAGRGKDLGSQSTGRSSAKAPVTAQLRAAARRTSPIWPVLRVSSYRVGQANLFQQIVAML